MESVTRKHNIRIAKLAFHAKESPIQTRAEVLSLVSSRFNSPDVVHSSLSGYPLIQDSLNPTTGGFERGQVVQSILIKVVFACEKPLVMTLRWAR